MKNYSVKFCSLQKNKLFNSWYYLKWHFYGLVKFHFWFFIQLSIVLGLQLLFVLGCETCNQEPQNLYYFSPLYHQAASYRKHDFVHECSKASISLSNVCKHLGMFFPESSVLFPQDHPTHRGNGKMIPSPGHTSWS